MGEQIGSDVDILIVRQDEEGDSIHQSSPFQPRINFFFFFFFFLGNIKYDDYGDGCHFKFEFRSFISLSFRESASGLKMEGELTSVVV